MRVIDVLQTGVPGLTAAYLLPDAGPALVDCGSAASLPALEAALGEAGVAVADLRHLLLTHIHLDHAGAAGALARRNPALTVWVHERGARHLVDPSRLLASAARVFGGVEAMRALWGDLEPVPAERLRPVDRAGRLLGIPDVEALPTPGHATHHLAFVDADGTCYAGDVAGVAFGDGRYVLPDAPPPDIDVDGWRASIDAIRRRRPPRVAPTHFGPRQDVDRHLDVLEATLGRWAERATLDQESFVRAAAREVDEVVVDPDDRRRYRFGDALGHSWVGFRRWHDRRDTPAS